MVNQLLSPFRNRLLMFLFSVPLLVPVAHLAGLFTYGDFSTRRSLLIDYFMAAFVAGIWVGVREYWRLKDMPPAQIRRTPRRASRLHMLRVFAVFYLKIFVCYIVIHYIYWDLMSPLLRAIIGGGICAFGVGVEIGVDLIGRYFFVVPKAMDLPRQEPR